MKVTAPKDRNKSAKSNDGVLSDIYKAIKEIRYGLVQIHIQDGKVVQIDKVNKVRMC